MNSENAKSSTFSARKTRSDIRTYPRKLKKFKGDESIHLRTSSDFGTPSKTSHPMCTLHPIWWRAILINPSSPSKYWSILQNLQIRINLQICHLNQGLDDQKFSVSENSSLAEFKSLHILHNFMWVSRFRSVGTLQGPAAKISCFRIHPLSSLTGKMIFPFKYIPGGTTKIWKSNNRLIWGLLLCSSFLVACTQLLWATGGTTAAEPCLHCPGPSHEDGTNTRLCFVFIFLLYKVKVKTLRSLGHKKFQLHFMENFLKDNIKLWHFSFSE